MTSLRQSAIMELEKIPEDKLSFVIQIMQGLNGLYNDTDKESRIAYELIVERKERGVLKTRTAS